MRKIRMDLDRLDVESFDTAVVTDARGTVHGHFYSQLGTCDGRVATCQAGGTCAFTCGSKCGTTLCA